VGICYPKWVREEADASVGTWRLDIRPCYSVVSQRFKMSSMSSSERSISGSKHGENVVATVHWESSELKPSQLDAIRQREGRLI
jgi:hypothetical protein